MAPETWWYVARATGLVAWALAVGSLALGLALATRALGNRPKGPWLLDLHRWTGGLALVLTGAHVVALLADSYVHLDLGDVLVPLASEWKPGPVAWGVVALWLLVAVEVTSLLMRRLPKRLWRAVHLSSYGVAVAATIHGVSAGTDASHPAVPWSVLGGLALLAFFATYRRLAPKRARRALPPRPSRGGRSGLPLQHPEGAET